MKQPKQHPYSRLLKSEYEVSTLNELFQYAILAAWRLTPFLLASLVTTALSMVIGFLPGTIIFGIFLVWIAGLYLAILWTLVNWTCFHILRFIGWTKAYGK